MSSKNVLITGCSKHDGVGFNLAKQFLERGDKVIATVRNLEKNDLNNSSFSTNPNLDIQALDLCQEDSIQSLIEYVLEQYGHIDILINNAANVAIGAVETLSQEDLQRTFQTKVFGPIALIQGFAPSMRERQKGLLVTTSSIFCASNFSPPGIPAYMSALCAFERIQENLAVELAPWNIKIINFQAGPINTSLTRQNGSRKSDQDPYYEHYLNAAYDWYRANTEYQSAEQVASAMIAAIEKENIELVAQNGHFSQNFVKRYRSNTEVEQSKLGWIQYFKNK